MDIYNGKINVESNTDGRTVFTLVIPIVSGEGMPNEKQD